MKEAHLRPTTLSAIMGARPLMTTISTWMGILMMPTALAPRKSITAMRSCVKRKKSGAVVTSSTHLLLLHEQSGEVRSARAQTKHRRAVRHHHLVQGRIDVYELYFETR